MSWGSSLAMKFHWSAGKGALAIEPDRRRQEALARLAAVKLKFPADYKFDRDEANDR